MAAQKSDAGRSTLRDSYLLDLSPNSPRSINTTFDVSTRPFQINGSVGNTVAILHVTDHVQVVMVNVEDFDRIVSRGVRNGPTVAGNFFKIDTAFVVSMVLLRWSDEGIDARRIDIISDLFFRNLYVVTLSLP